MCLIVFWVIFHIKKYSDFTFPPMFEVINQLADDIEYVYIH